jgi:Flp pilus assembly CpaF family ATPase
MGGFAPRGNEALDGRHAMTSGHDCSLTAFHANNLRLALNRQLILAMSAGRNLSPLVVGEMVDTGVDMVIRLTQRGRGCCARNRSRRGGWIQHGIISRRAT